MTTSERRDHFIQRATEMHKGKFDYSKVDYKTAKDPVEIICPIHGSFYQMPDKHVSKGSRGCQKCWEEARTIMLKNPNRKRTKRKPLEKEIFVQRAKKKFGDKYKYDLSNYIGLREGRIKITCPLHGEIENTPQNHLISSTGCPKCGLEQKNLSKTNAFDEVIIEMTNLYNGKYEYPEYNKTTYKNKRSKIEIICTKHGKFEKSAQKHLCGQACWQCKVEEMIEENVLIGGYSERLFEERPELKSEKGELYYLRINDGQLYKIGITRIGTSNRIKALKSLSKGEINKIEKVIAKSGSIYECFQLEQKILEENKHLRVNTNWSTEVFSGDIFGNITQYFNAPPV